MPQSNPLHILWFIATLWLLPAIAQCDEITIRIPTGLKAMGNYHQGEKGKPAILVLHGFLQTHQFSTVRLIATELADAGYTILSPTLTLNIDQRSTSLSCDAIQHHSVEQATQEIVAWINWLKQQGKRRIILIGHSTGSDHLLSYLHNRPDPAVVAFIATSVGPVDNWQKPDEYRRQRAKAKTAVATGDKSLKTYSLVFCRNNYTAPASDFLSYLRWDRNWIINSLKASPVPTTVVLGKEDKWLPPKWSTAIKQARIPLISIPEANHYFSGISEFDFQEAIRSLVVKADNGNRVKP